MRGMSSRRRGSVPSVLLAFVDMTLPGALDLTLLATCYNRYL